MQAGLGLISSLCRRADLPRQEQVCLRQEGPSGGVTCGPLPAAFTLRPTDVYANIVHPIDKLQRLEN